MLAQCYEHRFGYYTNAKTCFNVHIGAILAERRVLLGNLRILYCVVVCIYDIRFVYACVSVCLYL